MSGPTTLTVPRLAMSRSNPGTTDMEIITKQEGVTERLQQTDELDEGRGYAIGTVFRLDDGSVIWVPEGGTP